ncbi:cell division protein ZipA [Catenovulum sp. 2E275]|uniref:cell division protein ZipA n=1 Tax=Catenovulum sp. 2E275 TaxID=2980497 RepID=UPI0021CF960B|nr:cell division protein ZipA [Catenovulum sp. 2E275]MCU4676145.1 cell division protein ZipA [Catenovulum sp. 2E275]
MAEELRIVFMVLGLIAIIALVVHGFYTVRKNKKAAEPDYEPQSAPEDEVEYVSKARVVGRRDSAEPSTAATAKLETEADSNSSNPNKKFSLKDGINRIKTDKPVEKERVEPDFGDTQLQMNLPQDDSSIESFNAADEEVDISEQLLERESGLEEQPDLLEQAESDNSADIAESDSKAQNTSAQPQEVLILNVVAAEGQVMSGAVLLPTLLTLGFKFGEYNIFHRHEDESGEGEVLFSLANMFNPGTFDIDNIEQFTTQGISLFLSLPVAADSTATFNMMHNAAKKIAAEFDGQVLDGQRNLLTRQTLQHYVERIREFERKQLLR